jgi:multidrug efflux pump subunit AcrB
MKAGEFSVKNSLFVNLLTIFLLLTGVASMYTLNREAFPNISRDVVTVRTDYFGSPAREIENLITIPLEEEVFEVDDIDELSSVSSENMSLLIVKIDPDVDNKDRVINDIQRSVDRVTDLPEDAEDPVVREMQTKSFPVLEVAISGEMEESELQAAAKTLEDQIREIDGVATIKRSGWHEPEIWVEVDPEKLIEYHISTEEVIEALRTKNLNLPAGFLKEPGQDFLIRTLGEFETPEEVNQVIIRANDAGHWIRVRDIGNAKWAFEEDDLIHKSFGTQAINLNVLKRESGDIITVVERVKEEIKKFLAVSDQRIRVKVVNDLSYYVKRRLRVLVNNGFIGLALVTLCLVLMMDKITASMTALGIPLAISVTLLLMGIFGFTINLLTMFGMIMVLGLVVDDAIVVSENIHRHMEMGKTPEQAAIDATNEVWKPVTATVLTTIAAFVPLFFMSGTMGKYVFYIPAVVIMTLVASLVECLFILPSHVADLSKISQKLGRFHPERARESHWFRALQNGYRKLLTWVLLHRYQFVQMSIGVIVAAIFIYKMFMTYHMFPMGLIEQFFIRVEAPIGTSLEETSRRLEVLEKIISDLPPEELDAYVTEVGLMQEDEMDPFTNRGSHLGQILVFLTPEQHRKRKARTIIQMLREQAKSVEGFNKIYFDERESGPPVGAPVAIEIRGTDYERIVTLADKIKAFLGTRKGVYDVRHDFEFGKKEYRIFVNEEQAARSGLSIERIASTVRHAFEGSVATTIKKSDQEIDVRVRFPREWRENRDAFKKIKIPNSNGNLIPLSSVSNFEIEPGLTAIKHLDRKRVVMVTAEIDEKVTSSLRESAAVQKWMAEMKSDFLELNVSYGGEAEESQESFRDFKRVFPLALLFIFVILAALFRSIAQPLVVMLTIPFGLVGVVFAFFLHFNTPLSFMAMLGMIGLSGIVVNDAIVMVTFINSERDRVQNQKEAIIEGAVLRLRPVLLTTATTVFGLGPVAYGLGGDDPFIKPMALAIAWGLFFATTITLLVIPCVYSIFDELSEKMRHRMSVFVAKLQKK